MTAAGAWPYPYAWTRALWPSIIAAYILQPGNKRIA